MFDDLKTLIELQARQLAATEKVVERLDFLCRAADLLLTTHGTRMMFGSGPAHTDDVQLSGLNPIAIFQNKLSRPLQVIVRVNVAGAGVVALAAKLNAPDTGINLDLSVVGDQTDRLLILPNERLWIIPTLDPQKAVVTVESIDIGAWLDGFALRPGTAAPGTAEQNAVTTVPADDPINLFED